MSDDDELDIDERRMAAGAAACAAQPVPTAAPAEPVALKDHQIRELVNEVTAIAKKFGHTEQLREKISRALAPALKAATPPARLHAPLSDEQIAHLWDIHVGDPVPTIPLVARDIQVFARAIEAELRGITAAPAAQAITNTEG